MGTCLKSLWKVKKLVLKRNLNFHEKNQVDKNLQINISISDDFEAKNFHRKLEKLAKFLTSKAAEMKILLCKWHMAIKRYFIIFFFIIEKFDFLVEMPPEREVL